MKSYHYFSLLFLIVFSSAGLTLQPASAADSSPNFVVILTDDQSWVGSSLQIDPEDARTRSDFYQTPNIERLAKMGMRFTRGYSPAPFCCPTRRSLLIGQTPARHIYQKDQQNWTTRYREHLSLPQILKQANPRYRTAHFGKWDMRFDDVTPEEMGYDQSDGYTNNGTGGGKGAGGGAILSAASRNCGKLEGRPSMPPSKGSASGACSVASHASSSVAPTAASARRTRASSSSAS